MPQFTTFRGTLQGDNTLDALARRTYDLPADADPAKVKKAVDELKRANPTLAGPNLAVIKPGTIITVPDIADVPIRPRPGGLGGIGGIGGIPGFPPRVTPGPPTIPIPGIPLPGPIAPVASPALQPVLTRVARAAQILDQQAGRRERGLADARVAAKDELALVLSDDLKSVRDQPTLKQRFKTIAEALAVRGGRIEEEAKESAEAIKTLRVEVKKMAAVFGEGGLPV